MAGQPRVCILDMECTPKAIRIYNGINTCEKFKSRQLHERFHMHSQTVKAIKDLRYKGSLKDGVDQEILSIRDRT